MKFIPGGNLRRNTPEVVQLNKDPEECVVIEMPHVPCTLQAVPSAEKSWESITASKAVTNDPACAHGVVPVSSVDPAISAAPVVTSTLIPGFLRVSNSDEDSPPLSPVTGWDSEGLSTIISYITRLSHTDQAKVFTAVQPHEPSPRSMFRNSEPVSKAKFHRLHSQYTCKYQGRNQETLKTLDNLRGLYNGACEKIKQQGNVNQNVQLALKKDLEYAQSELAAQKEKIKAFETVHIRSVNAVGAGIEPITDQTFASIFVDYHHQVYQWCRQNLRGCEFKPVEQVPLNIRAVLDRQFAGKWEEDLSVSRAAEMIIWDIIEARGICPSFPISVLQGYESGLEMESMGKAFARSDRDDHDQKIDFWRSFTCALAFQSAGFPECIEEVGNEIVAYAISSLQVLLNVKEGYERRFDQEALLEIANPIVMTAAELKCQRGLFDVEGVQVGALFVESTMEDVGNVEVDRKKKWVVKAVLSDGVVRRAHKGAEEILGRACKARVVIAPEQF